MLALSFLIRGAWLALLSSTVILVIKILISGVILCFCCAMNPSIFFHWILFILLLKPCLWLYQTLSMIISNFERFFKLFPIWFFTAICKFFQPIYSHYLLWHAILFISVNTAIEVLFHCMELERTWQCSDFHATSTVSLLPCTSSFFHQSFVLDNVTRMDSDYWIVTFEWHSTDYGPFTGISKK